MQLHPPQLAATPVKSNSCVAGSMGQPPVCSNCLADAALTVLASKHKTANFAVVMAPVVADATLAAAGALSARVESDTPMIS